MVAVRCPLLAHASGPVRIFERVVEREQRHFFFSRNVGKQRVEAADLCFGIRPAVVPRQHIGEQDAQAELLAAPHHGAQVLRRAVDITILRDVVDAALHH